MTASPTPITAWTPTIAPKTSSKATGALAPNSHSIENPRDEKTTEAQAATPVAPVTPPAVSGSHLRMSRNNAYPP